MSQITIIGLGAIGGSIGMALARSGPAEKGRERADLLLVGYDPDPQTAGEARARGAVSQVARTLKEAAEQADMLIIAQPAPLAAETLARVGPFLPAGCVVTDTASTKVAITRSAEEHLPAEVGFVGGHPIPLPSRQVDDAAGIGGADPDLLRGAVYCLTPTARTPSPAVEAVGDLVQVVGASPFFLDPYEHDGLLAGISQAPYVVAAVMLSTIAGSASWRDLKLVAGPIFQRLNALLDAQSADFYQTCLTNRQPLISWLDRVVATLQEVRQELAEQGSAGEHFQEQVRRARTAYEDYTRRRDERLKEMEAATPRAPTAREMMAGIFLPRLGRLRREEKKE